MTKFNINIICCLVVLLFSSAVIAGTTDIAPVYRGTANSLHVIYESPGQGEWYRTVFDEGLNPTYPLHHFQEFLLEDISDESIDYTIGLPNYIDQEPIKFMRIQLSFNFEVSSDDLEILVYGGTSPDPGIITGGSPSGSATHHYFDVELRPNPDFEYIGIFWAQDDAAGGDSIDDPTMMTQIEIDTISIPEPATIAILTLGSLGLIRKRLV